MNARILRRAATGLAAWGLLAGGGLLWAADSITAQSVAVTAPAAQIADVELAPGGMLYGVVADGSGVGSADVVVTVRQQDRVIAEAITGPDGKFVMAGLPGGVFQINTSSSQTMFRLWATGTAPPGARPAALLVHDMQVVRGQSRLGRLLSRPIVIAGLVATAVAVPVAIHEIQIHQKSGS